MCSMAPCISNDSVPVVELPPDVIAGDKGTMPGGQETVMILFAYRRSGSASGVNSELLQVARSTHRGDYDSSSRSWNWKNGFVPSSDAPGPS